MKAMILAAGRGERMRPLTDKTPKPLLSLGTCTLIERHLQALQKAGFKEVLINHAWLGEKIEAQLGDGTKWGLKIQYSPEPEGGLETAGGIATALDYLGSGPFFVVNGDIFTDMDFAIVFEEAKKMTPDILAHLYLVENPSHHAEGDFSIRNAKLSQKINGKTSYTFSGMGIYQARLFHTVPKMTREKLLTLFLAGIEKEAITASVFQGDWLDVGTVDRLEEARDRMRVGV